MRTHLFLICFCIVAVGSLASCSPVGPENNGLGVHIRATITQSQLDSIRSFRILAFDQDIYKCNVVTHGVTYGRVGYASSYSFNWTSKEQKVPKYRLYLPKSAMNKKWVIQVEAYNVTQSAQPITKIQGETEVISEIVAQGCVSDVQFLKEDVPVRVSIELFSRN